MSQDINLYEERLRPRRDLATARNLGVAALVTLVAVSGLAAWSGHTATQKTAAAAALQKQLAAEQEKLVAQSRLVSERRVSPALAAELDKARATLAGRTEVMSVLESGQLGNTSGFSRFFSGFARQASLDIWLTGFRMTRGGEEIEIRGRMFDPARLPTYVQGLSGDPVFQGRRFASLDMQGIEPEAESKDSALAQSAPARSTTSGNATAKLPRYVEFTLRSELPAVSGSNATRGGAGS
ncbi:PilN domain-containing protein [Propionivibrio limicola]|uniref:PilN domain-containing protein n=1 Tax=Propionivibrio limicola TaxID=167645 RepID=UPI0012911A7A|nr:PilN domain-containing protein [Propionivibrio limicola]